MDDVNPPVTRSNTIGRALSAAWQHFSFTRFFMRASCTVVTFALCFMAALPIICFLFPQLFRIYAFFNLFPPNPSFEIPSQFKGRNFYVHQGNTLLGLWHIVPDEVRTLNTSEEYTAFLSDTRYPIMLYFHGNKYDRASVRYNNNRRARYARLLEQKVQLLIVDYRGYGDAAGAANGRSTTEDVITVFLSVIEPHRGSNSVYFYGHSLGTAISSRALHELEDAGYEIDGLLLESPMYAAKDNAKTFNAYKRLLGWWLPTAIQDYLLDNAIQAYDMTFEVHRYLAGTKCPVLLMAAEDDPYTYVHLVRKLYDQARSANDDALVFLVEFRKCFHYEHHFMHTSKVFPDILSGFFSVVQTLKEIQLNETSLEDMQFNETLSLLL